jgi:hypothetical protein
MSTNLASSKNLSMEEQEVERYSEMTPAVQMRIVCDLTTADFDRIRADLQRRYPTADQREFRSRAASHWLGPEVMLQVSGWDAEQKGH